MSLNMFFIPFIIYIFVITIQYLIMPVSTEQLLKLQDSRTLREELNLVIRWRVLTAKGGISRIVAYQDARDVQKVLDHVCGPENWENEPMNINGKLYMAIRIKTGDGWVSKADVGTETQVEAVKGEASDALKRAAVAWGIFRDIYELDYIVLKNNGRDPLTEDGTPLLTPDAITMYCNGISSSMGLLRKLYGELKHKIDSDKNLLEAFKTIKSCING